MIYTQIDTRSNSDLLVNAHCYSDGQDLFDLNKISTEIDSIDFQKNDFKEIYENLNKCATVYFSIYQHNLKQSLQDETKFYLESNEDLILSCAEKLSINYIKLIKLTEKDHLESEIINCYYYALFFLSKYLKYSYMKLRKIKNDILQNLDLIYQITLNKKLHNKTPTYIIDLNYKPITCELIYFNTVFLSAINPYSYSASIINKLIIVASHYSILINLKKVDTINQDEHYISFNQNNVLLENLKNEEPGKTSYFKINFEQVINRLKELSNKLNGSNSTTNFNSLELALPIFVVDSLVEKLISKKRRTAQRKDCSELLKVTFGISEIFNRLSNKTRSMGFSGQMIDRSETGFKIQFHKSMMESSDIGEIVAFTTSDDSNQLKVCMIRWIQRLENTDKTNCGVQHLFSSPQIGHIRMNGYQNKIPCLMNSNTLIVRDALDEKEVELEINNQNVNIKIVNEIANSIAYRIYNFVENEKS